MWVFYLHYRLQIVPAMAGKRLSLSKHLKATPDKKPNPQPVSMTRAGTVIIF